MNLYEAYESCSLCPHECGVNRNKGERGICGASSLQHISSICIHKGEEPVVNGEKGICNVFFSHCNLSCIFCQNHQISQHESPIEDLLTTKNVVKKIIPFLEKGIRTVGFVSPSHMALQVIDIIENLWHLGYKPITVLNSNAYDKPETLRMLESYIDVYLPDFKYSNNDLAFRLSGIKNYVAIAMAAIKEMYFQKGNTLHLNSKNEVERGLIIRHLVLPNHIENSFGVLDIIEQEISPRVTISLMSQYYPPENLSLPHEINRKLKKSEYDKVILYMQEHGMTKGWIQTVESSDFYKPDFNQQHPFE